MKGFIEVHSAMHDRDRSLIVDVGKINYMTSFLPSETSVYPTANCLIRLDVCDLFVTETYEEVKELINESTT